MDNRQQQIEKIADILCESKNHNCNGEDCKCIKQATDLYNANCRIVDEGSVVFKDSKIYLNEKHIGNIDFSPYDDIKALGFGNFEIIDKRKGFGTLYESVNQARKEAVKEILSDLYNKIQERRKICAEKYQSRENNSQKELASYWLGKENELCIVMSDIRETAKKLGVEVEDAKTRKNMQKIKSYT